MSFSEQIKTEILNNLENKKIRYSDLERFGEYLTISTAKNELKEEFGEYFDISKLDEKKIKILLKGVFLSSGCIVNPNYNYHLEITFKAKACATYVYDILSLLEFTPKIVKRKNANNYVIYIKEC